MAGIAYTNTVVHRSEIAAIFTGVGEGGRWIKALSYQMKTTAAGEAPKRSYELARSHFVSFRRGTNAYIAIADVENRSDHASYVHFGTPEGAPGAPAAIRGNPYLYLPAWGPHKSKRLRAVSGQQANPWLERACSQIARSYGAVQVI